MKKNITLMCLVALFLAPLGLAADKAKKVPKLLVTVTPAEPKDDLTNPSAWKPEIIGGAIKTATELQKVRHAAWQKRQNRTHAAYAKKQDLSREIYSRYSGLEYKALKLLKTEDPDAAYYYLESFRFGSYGFLPAPPKEEPSSKAFADFKKALALLDKGKQPELKKIDDDYDAVEKIAEAMYDAEVEKAEELYAANTAKP